MITQKKTYTEKDRIAALRILRQNSYNFLNTQRITGISRQTLRRWNEELGEKVESVPSPIEVALKEVDAQMKINDVEILKRYYNLRLQILDRIKAVATDETRIDHLTALLKSVSQELSLLDPPKGPMTLGDPKAFLDGLVTRFHDVNS